MLPGLLHYVQFSGCCKVTLYFISNDRDVTRIISQLPVSAAIDTVYLEAYVWM